MIADCAYIATKDNNPVSQTRELRERERVRGERER